MKLEVGKKIRLATSENIGKKKERAMFGVGTISIVYDEEFCSVQSEDKHLSKSVHINEIEEAV